MHNNRPEQWKVVKIILGETAGTGVVPHYDLRTTSNQPIGGITDLTNMWESQIFATKRDLCLSFLSEND